MKRRVLPALWNLYTLAPVIYNASDRAGERTTCANSVPCRKISAPMFRHGSCLALWS